MNHGNKVILTLLVSLAATVAVLSLLSGLSARAATLTVNHTTDSGSATLPSAALRASADRSPLCATADFTYPLTIPLAIRDTFGPRLLQPDGHTRYDFHRGIDWLASEGTPVRAVTTGTVRWVEKHWVSGTGSGIFVHLTHESIGCETRYNHLLTVTVSEGEQVSPGQIIGAVGETGATYPHLHFEVRQGLTVTQRAAIHPLSTSFLPWTNAVSPSVTLLGVYTEGTGLTTLVEVTSPYTEPDVTTVSVAVSGAVTDSRSMDYVDLNARTTVVADLDDPLAHDVCFIPADLSAVNGYRVKMAFRKFNYSLPATVTTQATDVDDWHSTDTASPAGGLEVAPSEQVARGVPGQTLTLVYTLTNRTGDSDTFTLTHLSAQGWPAVITPATPTLGNNDSIRVTVAITLNTDRFGPPDCGLLVAGAHSATRRVAVGFYRIYRDAYVRDAGGIDDISAGSMITPLKTIGYAISRTDDGGTVHVAQGMYTENLTLTETIDLLGGYTLDWVSRSLAAYSTTVDGGGKGTVLVIDGDYGPLIEGFTFLNGRSGGAGGGVRVVDGAAPTLRSNWILSNMANSYGGGLYVNDGPALIQGNTISGNHAITDGGGIYLTGDTTAQVLGNRILGNEATRDGGGVLVRSSGVYLANNLIRYNTAGNNGNGIRVASNSAPRIYHNTLIANHPTSGAGLYISTGSTPTVTNNIIANHAVGIHCSSPVTVSFNVISNTQDIEGCIGSDDIHADPCLRDEVHLAPESPAIDAGVSVGVNDDIDGKPRPVGAGYDIGAAEFPAALIVTKQASSDPVQAGAQLTYTLCVTNTGNIALHATVTDTLPTHITPGQTPGGTLILPGGTLTWTPIITAPGGVWIGTIVVTVELGYAGTLTNIVQATTDEGATGIYTETTMAFIPCAGLTGVGLAGPLTGAVGAAYAFTATVSPLEATLPVTYSWQATGQSGVVTTTNALSHTVSFAWATAGLKVITVTAANACSVQVATYTVTVEALPPTCHTLTSVELAGPLTGTIGAAYTFTATVGSITATTPITYTWQATEQNEVITTTNALSHAASFAWIATGLKVITVTAANACSAQVATHTITIETPPPCQALTRVQLAGPLTGVTGTAYTFTTTVSPLEATLPVTYSWQATGQSDMVTTTNSLSHAVSFAWITAGPKIITITATNACGVQVTTHTVTIEWYVYLPLIVRQ